MSKLQGFLNHFYLKIDNNIIENKLKLFTSKNPFEGDLIKGIRTAASSLDLTTLEGSDTGEKVILMCSKALNPMPEVIDFPHCAAVCVYPNLIKYAKKALKGSDVKVASVGTAFPSGQYPLKLKLADVKYCIHEGAQEIDMVISRGEFLIGNYKYICEEIKKVKKICISIKPKKPSKLKVILETGELGTPENIRKASLIAIYAGADFIKTSTGKIQPAATLPAVLIICEAIKDYFIETGKKIGIKAAGGIRTTKEAFEYMSVVKGVLGEEWLTPDLFRIGASSLLNDLTEEYKKY